MRKTLLVGGLTLAVLAGVAWFYHASTRKTTSGPTVITAAVRMGSVVKTFTATGAVAAVKQVTVYAPVGGLMGESLPQVGDTVKQGEIVAMQADQSLTDQLTADEDSLRSAELALAEAKATTPAVGSAGAVAALASVRSPLSGTVLTTDVTVGQPVKVGTVLASLTNPNVIIIQASLPFYEAGGLKPGQQVRIDLFDQSVLGTIQTVGSLNADQNGYVTVAVETHQVGSLAPGMSGQLTFYPAPSTNPSWEISGTGTIVQGPSQNLVSPYDGNLVSFSLEPGDTVKAGEDVATIQSSDPGTLQNAELQVEAAQSKVATDRANLAELNIPIPVSGVVTSVPVNPGQLVAAGAPILTVVDPNSLQVTVPVDEVDIDQLHVGQKAEVTAPGVPGVTFPATISQITPVGTNSNGVSTFPVTVVLNSTAGLKPGMTAVVTFNLATARGLTVPLSAIQRHGSRAFVMVQGTGGTHPVPVQVGLESDRLAIVRGPLQVGQRVVVASLADAQALENGRPGGFGGVFRALHGPGGGRRG